LTIQRHWQYWPHKTQDEDKQNKNSTQHRKLKKMSNTDLTKIRGWSQVLAQGKQFLSFLIRQPPCLTWCYTYSQIVLDKKQTQIT